ncbi:flagellar biosynthesis regulator FlaF [Brevundimonas sp.]
MSLQAYASASTRTENPREMEYRLFGQVTRALMHAATVDRSDIATRIDALDWNRRLWSVLATDCADPGNQMSKALRAQIISISLFVSRHSSVVMRGDDDFEALIDINKMIMQGLAGPGPGQAQAA